MLKTTFLLLSLSSLPIGAQQITVDASQITATQAILSYTAPSASAICSVQVSESSTLTPPVHDVDPSLFPNANLDSRAGNVTTGSQRAFIVGARRSDLALDNKLYSRALQADTQHYYKVICGDSFATGQFVTINPPLGNNYPDNPPFNPAGFGNYGWPTIDWNDQTKVYVDPLTGVAIKRFSQPGTFGFVYGGSNSGGALPVYVDKNSAWASAGNVTSGSATTLATYSGSASDPIFVTYDNGSLSPNGNQLTGFYPYNYTLDNVQLNLWGNGTASKTADRTVSVCLSFYDSGITCNSAFFDVVLPQTAGPNPVLYPPNSVFPNAGFWAGWGVAAKRNDFGILPATVSVTGNSVTNNAGAFNTHWTAGAKYYIAGSSPACLNNLCTLSSITNNQVMTIVESLPSPLTGVQGYSAAAGFVIKKKTGVGSISVSAASLYSVSAQNLLANYGGFQLCNENSVTVSYAADGATPIVPVAGELCTVSTAGPGAASFESLYLLIPSTGEVRFLNPLYVDTTGQGNTDDLIKGNGIHGLWGAYDASDPDTFYGDLAYSSGAHAGKHAIVKAKYEAGPQCVFQAYSAGANKLPLYAANSHNPGQDPLAYWYGGPQAKDSMDGLSSCISYTNLTLPSAGRDIDSQIQVQSNYKSVFGRVGGAAAMLGGKAMYALGQGEGPGLLYVFDLATGNLQYSGDTWSTYPLRWVGIHASGAQASDRFIGIVPSNGLGFYSGYVPDPNSFRGPYTLVPTEVYKNGAWSSDTSLPADNSINVTCPDGLPGALVANGAIGNNCIRFQSKMACNTNPYNAGNGQTEAQAFPCPYNSAYSMLTPVAPGDFIRSLSGIQAYNAPLEYLQVVQVTALASNNWQFTASRVATSGIDCANSRTTPEAWASGWTGVMVAACALDYFVDAANVGGGFFSAYTGGGHYSVGVGSSSGSPTTVTAGTQNYGHTIYYQRPFSSPRAPGLYVSADVAFHGFEAPSMFQSYASNMQLAVTDPVDRTWFLDFHSLNPPSGGGQESPVGNPTVFQTPGTLVSGTTSVYKFGAPAGTLDFKIQPVIAYAGPNILQDVSSPATGDVVTDLTPWSYCVVYHQGECRTGSAAGEAYLSVPFTGGGYINSIGYCQTNTLFENFPCVNTYPANAAEIIQSRGDVSDPHALHWRRIGMGLMGPGRQYEFSTAVPDPTGTWAVFACNWCDGVRNDLFMAKIPKLPGSTNLTQPGNDYVPLAVTLGPSPDMDKARVRFGYAENGNPAGFYCTTRQESCSTTTETSMPFAFESDGPVWQDCSGGCTIQVPALPGRVSYYAIDRKSSYSGRFHPGEMRVQANP